MATTTVAIAVTTCDRSRLGGTNYFPRTWESLVKSGLERQLDGTPLAFFVGGPGGSFAQEVKRMTGQPCFSAPQDLRLDVIRNSHRALAWLAGTRAEFGLLLQDDILVCRNWLTEARCWLAETAPSDGMLYSFATQYERVEADANLLRGWADYPNEEFYGCWCIAMPRSAIVSYLFGDERQRAEERVKEFDMSLKRHVIARGGRTYAHSPNTAIHVGARSSIGNVHAYTAGPNPLFRGEDYDATKGQ